ncbi:hypothetical protein C2845_PM10G09230 [Panicum miliaceum]|uniref:Uncharacterized protein n=1 Tax=Panicum miliaceum TaxID=4540 RepID=A0A3L6PAI6_PANMI|nr:hypothetical protein C2845_PM10G09230 [Panicum miliaceum]
MEDQTWEAYFTDTPPPEPSLAKIITDLRNRVPVSPIFVCLVCNKESSSQQHMAVHCKKHVQAGMAKGTVKHIKYYPDRTTCHFFGINPQPTTPQDSGSANRIKQVPMPSYKTVLYYAGNAFVSHLASMLPENPNGVGPIIAPIGNRSSILTLRLGSTRGTIAGDSEGMTFPLPGSSSSANNIPSGHDPKGKKVISGTQS